MSCGAHNMKVCWFLTLCWFLTHSGLVKVSSPYVLVEFGVKFWFVSTSVVFLALHIDLQALIPLTSLNKGATSMLLATSSTATCRPLDLMCLHGLSVMSSWHYATVLGSDGWLLVI